MDEDDGDYATLRELPLPPSASQRLSTGEDTASEEGKLLACVHDEHITYASTNQDFEPPSAFEERSPLLEIEQQQQTAIVHSNYENTSTQSSASTRTCIRRSDSGIVQPEDQGRSDSVSTEESQHSPPEPPGSNHSETSSGIHSNDSEMHSVIMATTATVVMKPVVIRRKSIRPNAKEIIAPTILEEDPYGRATNMRMTSFTDKNHVVQSCSATLPHYPTQPVQNVYPNCSTMPLPQHTTNNSTANMVNGNSCNVYPRQHTTIPLHHNGVKLLPNTTNHNPYITRITSKQDHIKYEPIYTKINRQSGELYHYSS
nr:unnamed protein product [Callosobruchus chinensis]